MRTTLSHGTLCHPNNARSACNIGKHQHPLEDARCPLSLDSKTASSLLPRTAGWTHHAHYLRGLTLKDCACNSDSMASSVALSRGSLCTAPTLLASSPSAVPNTFLPLTASTLLIPWVSDISYSPTTHYLQLSGPDRGVLWTGSLNGVKPRQLVKSVGYMASISLPSFGQK